MLRVQDVEPIGLAYVATTALHLNRSSVDELAADQRFLRHVYAGVNSKDHSQVLVSSYYLPEVHLSASLATLAMSCSIPYEYIAYLYLLA